MERGLFSLPEWSRMNPIDPIGRHYMTDVQDSATATARRLNHVEFVHRPGESELVIDLFEALGCPCHPIDSPPFGKYIVVQMDDSPHGENDIFVTEAEPEQLALEDALRGQIDTNSNLATASSFDCCRRNVLTARRTSGSAFRPWPPSTR